MLHTVHQGQPVSAPALRGPERCRQAHSRHLGIGERRQSRGGSGGVPSRRSQALGGGVRLHLVVHGGRTDASRQEGDTGRACHGQRYGGPCRCGALPCRRTRMFLRPHSETRPRPAGVRAHHGIHPRRWGSGTCCQYCPGL